MLRCYTSFYSIQLLQLASPGARGSLAESKGLTGSLTIDHGRKGSSDSALTDSSALQVKFSSSRTREHSGTPTHYFILSTNSETRVLFLASRLYSFTVACDSAVTWHPHKSYDKDLLSEWIVTSLKEAALWSSKSTATSAWKILH